MAADTTRTRYAKHPSQCIALVMGAAFALAGIAGFFVTGFDHFADEQTGETLLGFAVNPLHNIVHLVIGVAGLLMWRRLDSARMFGWLLFIGYGATFVYGLLVDKASDGTCLNLNGADDGLHIVSAVIGLAAALWPARDVVRDTDRDRDRTRVRSTSAARG